ncbi:MAG TPA: class I SAM-dependent methyltransferase [Polyangiaceae bacterium]
MSKGDLMNQNPTASDWVAVRGEKWLTQLSGMEAMLKPLDEPLIVALELEAACRIAEIGCGGGGTAIEILRRAPSGSVVHGFDISRVLVEAARGRIGPGDSGVVSSTSRTWRRQRHNGRTTDWCRASA